MTVRLYEGDKTETGGAGIEITDNKVVNLLLRSLNNLIKINADNEAYVDLQLADGIEDDANMPVGVNVGRVLQADGWLANGTLLVAKTTSGDEIRFLFADDGKLYTDNGTGTFKQIYLKPEVDALFQQLRSELSTVAFSGDYADLLNKPTLGTAAALDAGNLAGNVPVLDSNGKLDSSIVPSTGVMTSYTVTNKSDLTTLSSAVKGDIGIVTSENKTYILSNDPYSTLSNWTELLFPTGSVSSVNGFTGAVNLTTGYIQESGDNLFVSPTEKATWNNKLGANNVSTVALTGNYGDLNNKPVIDSTLNTSSTHAIQNGAVATAVNNINNSITTMQGDITTLQNTTGGATQDISNLQTSVTNLTTTVNGLVSDTAFGSSWDGDTTHAPSKNAVYDEMHSQSESLGTLSTTVSGLVTQVDSIEDIIEEGVPGGESSSSVTAFNTHTYTSGELNVFVSYTVDKSGLYEISHGGTTPTDPCRLRVQTLGGADTGVMNNPGGLIWLRKGDTLLLSTGWSGTAGERPITVTSILCTP